MENQELEIEKLKIEKSGISQFISKFVAVLMSIITACVLTVVGFIWQLRSEFSEEKKEREQIQKSIEEIKIDSKISNASLLEIRERMVRVEEKTRNIEEKVNK
jgi:hypothetical protein